MNSSDFKLQDSQNAEPFAGPEHRPRSLAELGMRQTVLEDLALKMMDLQFNPSTRFYVGPVQMKANNGALIIDDFGHQRLRPEELLTRWIVPLDRGIDFLTLAGGRKIEIPFEMLVVFATNIDPASLVDAAFLRRIQPRSRSAPVPTGSFARYFAALPPSSNSKSTLAWSTISLASSAVR